MTKGAWALALAALATMPVVARADIITGVLNISGTADFTSSGVTFIDNEFTINSPASAQEGGFTVLAGTTGIIDNLTDPPYAVGPLDVPDFIAFNAAPNISITLTFLDPGFDGASGCTASPSAPGQLCTPDSSPFNFQNTSTTSSSLTFRIAGIEVDSITGDTVPITGQFTLPFTSQSFQQLLETAGSGGTATASFAAQIDTVQVSPLPEPSAIILMFAGIGVMGLARLRSVRSLAKNSVSAS